MKWQTDSIFSVGVDLTMTEGLQRAGVNSRSTFKRVLESRLRYKLNQVRDDVRAATRFPSIAKSFVVQQDTEGDTLTFKLLNVSYVARFLEQPQGIPAHTIEQRPHMIPRGKLTSWAAQHNPENPAFLEAIARSAIKRRGVIIEHPGIAPDERVNERVHAAVPEIEEVVRKALSDWTKRFGDLTA